MRMRKQQVDLWIGRVDGCVGGGEVRLRMKLSPGISFKLCCPFSPASSAKSHAGKDMVAPTRISQYGWQRTTENEKQRPQGVVEIIHTGW